MRELLPPSCVCLRIQTGEVEACAGICARHGISHRRLHRRPLALEEAIVSRVRSSLFGVGDLLRPRPGQVACSIIQRSVPVEGCLKIFVLKICHARSAFILAAQHEVLPLRGRMYLSLRLADGLRTFLDLGISKRLHKKLSPSFQHFFILLCDVA